MIFWAIFRHGGDPGESGERRLPGDQAGEEVVIPAGSLSFEPQGGFAGCEPDQVMGHMLDGAKIGWSMVGAQPALVIAKDHVHDPVQAVLDIPYKTPLIS